MISKVKQKVSWTELDEILETFCLKAIPFKQKFINIYGLPRGGLIPAVILSHKLGLPMITDVDSITTKTLIVDDIIDTGKSITRLLRHLEGNNARNKFKFATVFNAKLSPKRRPIFYARETNYWIVFPWETLESSQYDNAI